MLSAERERHQVRGADREAAFASVKQRGLVLSGEQVDRVREAMNTGFRGPVLVVDDGDNGVRIVLE